MTIVHIDSNFAKIPIFLTQYVIYIIFYEYLQIIYAQQSDYL